MDGSKQTPLRAKGKLRSGGFLGFGAVLDHAPELTRNWGPTRAFVAVLAIGALAASAARPDAAVVMGGIFLIAVGYGSSRRCTRCSCMSASATAISCGYT
jgi:hypothetical protein